MYTFFHKRLFTRKKHLTAYLFGYCCFLFVFLYPVLFLYCRSWGKYSEQSLSPLLLFLQVFFISLPLLLLIAFLLCAKCLGAVLFDEEGFTYYKKFYHKKGERFSYAQIKNCKIRAGVLAEKSSIRYSTLLKADAIFINGKNFQLRFEFSYKIIYCLYLHKDLFPTIFSDCQEKSYDGLQSFYKLQSEKLTEGETLYLIKSFCKNRYDRNGQALLANYRKRHSK